MDSTDTLCYDQYMETSTEMINGRLVIVRRRWCEATQTYVGRRQVWSDALQTWVG